MGRVSCTGRSLIVGDAQSGLLPCHRDLIVREGLHSFASVRLPGCARILGVINIISRRFRCRPTGTGRQR